MISNNIVPNNMIPNNIIPNNTCKCKKRILNEIKYINENMPQYHVEIVDENQKNIEIGIITPKLNYLLFTFTNDYPFKPPLSFRCNGVNYRYNLKNMPRKVEYLYYHPNDMYFQENSNLEHFKKPDCLCCSTLLCGENWSPVCKIANILNEIEVHNKLKLQIGYKLTLKSIFDKNLLPIDLLRFLYEFL